MNWIDTHCHLYLKEFEGDLDAIMQRAVDGSVNQFYLPAIDRQTHDAMLSVEEKYAGLCHAMIGLHPVSVKIDYEEELAIVESWLSKRSFAGIGETGLDYYWDQTFKPQQQEAFVTQMRWAKQYDLPVIIHSRESTSNCIELVRQEQDGSLRGIFHCFTGSEAEARQITELGFHLGIGGVLTYKNSSLRDVLKNLDLQWMVLETDAPYLSPQPYRGKRNEPSYMLYVAQVLADLKGMDMQELAAITTANAQRIFHPQTASGEAS